MTSSQSTLEREALDELERRLVGQGYTLTREPRPPDLPAFLGNFQPDAIATGKEPQLLVEVITRRGSGRAEATKVEQIRSLLRGHPDWRLEVVYATPNTPPPSIVSIEAIEKRFVEVRRLAATDRPAALIMAWSILEAAARALVPDRTARPLTPGSTVELLTSLGYMTQPQADKLREAAGARNLIVHGDVTVDVDPLELDDVLEIVEDVIRQPGGEDLAIS